MGIKGCCRENGAESYEGLEQLLERGRKLQSQAVYDSFARLVRGVKLALQDSLHFSHRSRKLKYP